MKELEARKKEEARLKELEARKKEEEVKRREEVQGGSSPLEQDNGETPPSEQGGQGGSSPLEQDNGETPPSEQGRSSPLEQDNGETPPSEQGGQGGSSPLQQDESEEEEYDEPLTIPFSTHSPIRPFINSQFSVNERIKANYWSNRKKAKQFPGTITRVNEKNTYDVLYDDRTIAKRVPAKYIQNMDEQEELTAASETNFSESSAIIPHWSSLAANDDANDDFCTVCKKGGVLICCDHCHRSYHKGCAEILRQFQDEIPEDYDFKCAQCKHEEGVRSIHRGFMPDMVFKRPACERCSKAKKKCIYYTAQGPCDKCSRNGLVCDTNELKRRGRRPSDGGSSRKKARRGGESPSRGTLPPCPPLKVICELVVSIIGG